MSNVSGLPQLQARLRQLEREHITKMQRALSDIGDVALGACVDRAPIDKGTLTIDLEKHIEGNECAIRIPENAPSSSYAITMHEDNYELGENSLGKQAKVGVEVGRGYIRRGVEAETETYKEIIKEILTYD